MFGPSGRFQSTGVQLRGRSAGPHLIYASQMSWNARKTKEGTHTQQHTQIHTPVRTRINVLTSRNKQTHTHARIARTETFTNFRCCFCCWECWDLDDRVGDCEPWHLNGCGNCIGPSGRINEYCLRRQPTFKAVKQTILLELASKWLQF